MHTCLHHSRNQTLWHDNSIRLNIKYQDYSVDFGLILEIYNIQIPPKINFILTCVVAHNSAWFIELTKNCFVSVTFCAVDKVKLCLFFLSVTYDTYFLLFPHKLDACNGGVYSLALFKMRKWIMVLINTRSSSLP